MKNHDVKDDAMVFSFINGDKCKTLSDLEQFLYSNSLPFKERWLFYYFGKSNWIDGEVIIKMYDPSYRSYGGYIRGEIYYWKRYLENESAEKASIRKDIEETDEKPTSERINELFIKRGYEYVAEELNNDQESEQWKIQEEFDKDQLANWKYNWNEGEDRYCFSCQQVPCMCSDPEKTSSYYNPFKE